jgi:hypothetical protein
MERLPLILKQEVMCALHDAPSLRSTALCCSAFYNAFVSAEGLITANVIRNQIKGDLMPEAAAALESSRLEPWTRQRILGFMDQHFYSRRPPANRWTAPEAFAIGKLHSCVEKFTADFVAEMLRKTSALGCADDPPPSWPASRAETDRIQRAFYRFEVYCNLFRDRKQTLFKHHERGDLFFSKFAPWENEQLACVHDFLFRAVCPGACLRWLLGFAADSNSFQ